MVAPHVLSRATHQSLANSNASWEICFGMDHIHIYYDRHQFINVFLGGSLDLDLYGKKKWYKHEKPTAGSQIWNLQIPNLLLGSLSLFSRPGVVAFRDSQRAAALAALFLSDMGVKILHVWRHSVTQNGFDEGLVFHDFFCCLVEHVSQPFCRRIEPHVTVFPNYQIYRPTTADIYTSGGFSPALWTQLCTNVCLQKMGTT